eukprot:11425057-Karenia_brevis.AAC.1
MSNIEKELEEAVEEAEPKIVHEKSEESTLVCLEDVQNETPLFTDVEMVQQQMERDKNMHDFDQCEGLLQGEPRKYCLDEILSKAETSVSASWPLINKSFDRLQSMQFGKWLGSLGQTALAIREEEQ